MMMNFDGGKDKKKGVDETRDFLRDKKDENLI